jgi:HAD superfamily hydrolase (TIGR01459 family)
VTRVLRSIDDIVSRYDAVFCDVWGVVHDGRAPYASAVSALQRLRAAGKTVILLTNVPKPRWSIPPQLDRLGVPRDAWDVIVTSGDAIRAELAVRAPGPMFKIGPGDYDKPLWEGLGLVEAPLAEARFIGISGLNRDDETPADYAAMLREARARDLELLCANPDIVVQFGDRMIWCAGAVARDYAEIGGRVVMAGKPYAPIYELAYKEYLDRRRLAGGSGAASTDSAGEAPAVQVDKSRILAIGDGLPTDIAGANAQGLDCIFIASGMHGESLWSGGVLDREKVDTALKEEGARATYAMQALA